MIVLRTAHLAPGGSHKNAQIDPRVSFRIQTQRHRESGRAIPFALTVPMSKDRLYIRPESLDVRKNVSAGTSRVVVCARCGDPSRGGSWLAFHGALEWICRACGPVVRALQLGPADAS